MNVRQVRCPSPRERMDGAFCGAINTIRRQPFTGYWRRLRTRDHRTVLTTGLIDSQNAGLRTEVRISPASLEE